MHEGTETCWWVSKSHGDVVRSHESDTLCDQFVINFFAVLSPSLGDNSWFWTEFTYMLPCWNALLNQYNGKSHCTKMNHGTTMMNLPKITYPRAYSMILLLICYCHSQKSPRTTVLSLFSLLYYAVSLVEILVNFH